MLFEGAEGFLGAPEALGALTLSVRVLVADAESTPATGAYLGLSR